MTPARDRYLRLLVALSVVAIVTYEYVGWPWLTFLPATGLLFAAGAAFLASAVGASSAAGPAVRAALRRLLLPFWLFAAAAVPLMLTLGWQWSEDLGSAPFDAGTAWLWLLPIADPPVSTPGLPWTTMLWFVRAALWFVLLTPVLLWISRRWPLRLAVPPVLLLLLISVGLINLYGRVLDVVVGLCVYVCCWLLGFAYADGRLGRMFVALALPVGGAAVAAGVLCFWWLGDQYDAYGLTDVPLATLLVSAGAVLLLLRAEPAFRWLGRLRRTNGVLHFVTGRFVTIVLWAGPAVGVAPFVLDTIGAYGVVGGRLAPLLTWATAWVLLFSLAVLLGWAERPLLPARRRRRVAPPREFVFEGNVVAEQPALDERR